MALRRASSTAGSSPVGAAGGGGGGGGAGAKIGTGAEEDPPPKNPPIANLSTGKNHPVKSEPTRFCLALRCSLNILLWFLPSFLVSRYNI